MSSPFDFLGDFLPLQTPFPGVPRYNGDKLVFRVSLTSVTSRCFASPDSTLHQSNF